ncbi:MAG TPA: hypothetical protein VKJ47_11420, partial [Candidatus Binatia bacterium]|nr:hypothetical protein [Candidatus Binatia bacterium]
RLSAPYADAVLRRHIAEAVADLETHTVADLVRLLAQVQIPLTENESLQAESREGKNHGSPRDAC